MNKDVKRVGEQVRQNREALKISVREFAAQCNVSPSWLSKFERGIEHPGEDAMWRIGKQLNWSRDQIERALLNLGIVPAQYVEILRQQPDLLNLIGRAYIQVGCMEASRKNIGQFAPSPRA